MASSEIASKRYVSMASGGTRAFSYMGALDALEDHLNRTSGTSFEQWRASLKGVSGTSAGSLCGLSILLGMDRERRQQLSLHPRKIMRFPDVTLLLTRFGLEDGSAFRECIREVLTQGGLSPESTLGDVKRLLHKEFVCMCTDLKTGLPLPLSSTDTPEVLVCDAVYASCSIPFMFAPSQIRDHLATDGCLTCTLPVVFPEEETLFFDLDLPRSVSSISSWPDFMSGIIRTNLRLQDEKQRLLISKYPNSFLLLKLFPPFSAVGMDFEMEESSTERLMNEGYASVLDILYAHNPSSLIWTCLCELIAYWRLIAATNHEAVQDAEPPNEDTRCDASCTIALET